MEHLVQFTISMDDEKITRLVEANAEKIIVEDLKNEVKKIMFETRYDFTKREIITSNVTEWMRDRVNEFLEAHKDEIIKLAAEDLASRMSRMKAVKEAAVEAVK